jgi:tetratricopeptide (TPR) repeat protein
VTRVTCILIAITLFFAPITLSASQEDAPEAFYRHVNIGISYIGQGEYAKAVEELKLALKIRPDHLSALINLGLAYHHQLKYDDATRVFRRVLEINPDEPYSHFNLGLIYKARGRFDEALEEFRKVVELDPEDPPARYNLGMMYLKKRMFEDAIREFEKVIELSPDAAPAYYGLGRTLMSAGRREEAKKALDKFYELKKSGFVTTAKEKRFREGKYLEPFVERVAEGGEAPTAIPPIAVRFLDVTSGSGLDEFLHGGSPRDEVKRFGSGAAFLDYDGDGYDDLYIANCGRNVLYRNNGDGTFTDVTETAGVGDERVGMGCVFGDYDNDGDLDIYVTNFGRNTLYRNNGDGTFRDVTEEAGVSGEGFSTAAVFGDYDKDGDLDLFVASYGGPLLLYRNNGDGAFTEVGEEANLLGSYRCLSLILSDLDEDRDPDVLLVNEDGPNALYINNGDGTFSDATDSSGLGSGGRGAALGDYNNDGDMDIYLTGNPNMLYRNDGKGSFKNVPIPEVKEGWGVGFLDHDNDGDVDVFVVDGQIEDGSRANLLLKNNGGTFSLEVISESSGGGRGLAMGDYDNDGDTDLLIVNNGATPTLLRNDGGSLNKWLKVKLVGTVGNKSGIGSKVDLKLRNLWQRREVRSTGYLSSESLTVQFGLADAAKVDLVQVTWPRGAKQFLANVTANLRAVIKEEITEVTSCPFLYAWDGSGFKFVTDFLGVGVVGYLVAPGVYYRPRGEEYVKIEEAQLRPKDGLYQIRVADELQEVIYLDEVKLLVIDHPSDVEVYPNERFMTSPPFPEFKIYAVRDARPPVSAYDDKGNDILPLIRERDRLYPESFRLLPYRGYAEMHSITLDLGDIGEGRAILIIYGWVRYSESYSNFAASQGGVKLVPPYLEVKGEEGEWVKVMENMGFPAGMPKFMTVDLTGKFLSGEHKIRITTNMEIYFDQILVGIPLDDVPLRVKSLEPSQANLRFKGYGIPFSPDGRKPFIYDYYDAKCVSPFDSHKGSYTRYGDVRELLLEGDDRYVIMHHGDEVAIDFPAPPEPPSGWKRDFLFYSSGFSKDMDPHTAYPLTVTPLPFQGMSDYPYPETESYPLDEEHLRYIRKYNTREIGGL